MIRYCGRDFTSQELAQIQALIKNNPQLNRSRLSKKVCTMFQWLKPDGKLKDMSCRVAMLRMHEDGLIRLPPPTKKKQPIRKIEFTPATKPQEPIVAQVNLIPKLCFRIVDKSNSALWNEYIARYHYLGYTPLPGAQLRYFIYVGEQLVALTDLKEQNASDSYR